MKRVVLYMVCMFLMACSENGLRENIRSEEALKKFLALESYADIRCINFYDNKNICDVHFIEMDKQKVRIVYGLPDMAWLGYIFKIREKLFPNCDDAVMGGCVIGYEKYTDIYVCENCNIDRNKWIEENWESWKKNIYGKQ